MTRMPHTSTNYVFSCNCVNARSSTYFSLCLQQSLSQEYGRLKNAVEEFDDLCSRFVSFSELLTMADTSKDFAIYSEVFAASLQLF